MSIDSKENFFYRFLNRKKYGSMKNKIDDDTTIKKVSTPHYKINRYGNNFVVLKHNEIKLNINSNIDDFKKLDFNDLLTEFGHLIFNFDYCKMLGQKTQKITTKKIILTDEYYIQKNIENHNEFNIYDKMDVKLINLCVYVSGGLDIIIENKRCLNVSSIGFDTKYNLPELSISFDWHNSDDEKRDILINIITLLKFLYGRLNAYLNRYEKNIDKRREIHRNIKLSVDNLNSIKGRKILMDINQAIKTNINEI